MVLHDPLPKFKKLRVFSLAGYYITQLPNSIEDWRLLKYLNLSGTMVRSLPESTSSLFNLQVLILRNCSLFNLIELCHLDIKGADSLEEMPLGMMQLKNLQILSNFILGKGESISSLKDLKNLKFLQWELCILGLENLNDLQDAKEGALQEKHNLEALSLQWGSELDSLRGEAIEENVLDILQPHKNIKRLRITFCGGERFPFWLGDTNIEVNKHVEVFSCLSELSVVKCPKLCGRFPKRLPSLERLFVSKCAELVVPVSGFPMLCKLEIDNAKD